MLDESIEEFRKAPSICEAPLAHAYARSGSRTEALRILNEILATSKQSFVDPRNVAVIYVGLGERDQALDWLEDAYEKGEPILVYMFGPSWPLASFDLIQIDEPGFTQERWSTDKGCAFPLNQVKIVVHSSFPQLAPEVVDFFGKLSMDCDEISSILLTMKEKDLTPEEAVLMWLKENESVWSQWVPSDVAQKVKQALNQQ